MNITATATNNANWCFFVQIRLLLGGDGAGLVVTTTAAELAAM
jgi:hypothetical protein